MSFLLKQAKRILIECLPIILMVILIPWIGDDFLLLGAYILIIAGAFFWCYNAKDWVFFLFGLMPIWLPVLWAYGFIAMRRAVKILES